MFKVLSIWPSWYILPYFDKSKFNFRRFCKKKKKGVGWYRNHCFQNYSKFVHSGRIQIGTPISIFKKNDLYKQKTN